MLPNPIIHSRTSKVVALSSFLLCSAWTLFLSYEVYQQTQEEGFKWFSGLALECILLGFMGVSWAYRLYKRPMLDNLKYCVGWFSYVASFVGLAWIADSYAAATSLFLSLLVGSLIYYALIRALSKPAGFSTLPLHGYFSNILPALLSFTCMIDSFRFASYLDSENSHLSISLFGSLAISTAFYFLSSRSLKSPKEVTISEKQPLADKASL